MSSSYIFLVSSEDFLPSELMLSICVWLHGASFYVVSFAAFCRDESAVCGGMFLFVCLRRKLTIMLESNQHLLFPHFISLPLFIIIPPLCPHTQSRHSLPASPVRSPLFKHLPSPPPAPWPSHCCFFPLVSCCLHQFRSCFFSFQDQRSTVISLQKLIVREVANEERGLFLITAGIAKPEMMEVLASTKDERNTWMQLIQDAMQSM